mmetsp:Transcript_23236/g.46197  ORF Transcript_23236/g.46197 Transcript_23236/m.46197 type:complete len:218 (-) Transcript_23236:1679-2332(-)
MHRKRACRSLLEQWRQLHPRLGAGTVFVERRASQQVRESQRGGDDQEDQRRAGRKGKHHHRGRGGQGLRHLLGGPRRADRGHRHGGVGREGGGEPGRHQAAPRVGRVGCSEHHPHQPQREAAVHARHARHQGCVHFGLRGLSFRMDGQRKHQGRAQGVDAHRGPVHRRPGEAQLHPRRAQRGEWGERHVQVTLLPVRPRAVDEHDAQRYVGWGGGRG